MIQHRCHNIKLFKNTVNKLREAGYTITLKRKKEGKHTKYLFAHIGVNNIVGGMCTKNAESYVHINGKIAVDHKDCSDKWSKCPICLPLPRNEAEIKYLLEKIRFVGTDEGFKLSNDYSLDINKYE